MNLLAIETATDTVGVALLSGSGGTAERVHARARAHAELLAPTIEEVCAGAGCRLHELDVVAVDVGPGLFTGLRVGVGTAKALAQALGIGVVAAASLDILAAAAVEATDGPCRVVSVVDARRGEVFAAVYAFDGAPGPLAPDPADVRTDRTAPISPDELRTWCGELASEVGPHGRILVVGDGAVRYADRLVGLGAVDLAHAPALAAPPPLALARLAADRLARGATPLEAAAVLPEYRRPADAKINWEARPVAARRAGTERDVP